MNRRLIVSVLACVAVAAALVVPFNAKALATDDPAKQEQKPADQSGKAPATNGGNEAKDDMKKDSAPTAEAPAAPQGVPVPDGPVVEKKELEGGLIVEDIKIGDGYEIQPHDIVVAHYHGTLKADPKVVFDSSFQRGEPAPFPLDGVIQGWQKGVPGMKVGGVRRLTIPAAMAYGEQSPSAEIPANSDLVFVIQMIDAVQKIDEKEGQGDAAQAPCLATTTYTIKDESGKEIAKADSSNPYIWFPGEMMDPMTRLDPMQSALAGMKVGGKRKIVIPAQWNNSPPQLNVKRPTGVKLVIELELTALRNLPGGGGGGGRR